MSDERITDELLKQWAATRADDAGRLARELLALREQAGEPVAWRCQLLEGGDWFYFLTHPDLADNSPWETIVSLSREELQQELVALTKDRKSLRGMATLLAKAREPAAPPAQPGAVRSRLILDAERYRLLRRNTGREYALATPDRCHDLLIRLDATGCEKYLPDGAVDFPGTLDAILDDEALSAASGAVHKGS